MKDEEDIYAEDINITDKDEVVWTTSSNRKYKEPYSSRVQYTKVNQTHVMEYW